MNTPGISSEGIAPACLCEQCQALVFDDEAECVEELDKTYFREDENARMWFLDLEYYMEDSLPGLENLHNSASAGCEFCDLLRQTITSEEESVRAFTDLYEDCTHQFRIKLRYLRSLPGPVGRESGDIELESIHERSMYLEVALAFDRWTAALFFAINGVIGMHVFDRNDRLECLLVGNQTILPSHDGSTFVPLQDLEWSMSIFNGLRPPSATVRQIMTTLC